MTHPTRSTLVLAAGLAGCFGAGPTPTSPSEATIVFQIAPESGCNAAKFISDVVIGPDRGYAITPSYTPNNCGGGSIPLPAVEVVSFSKLGAEVMAVGEAGPSNNGGTQRAAVFEGAVLWALPDGNSVTVATANTTAFSTISPGGGGNPSPIGLVVDDRTIHVGVVSSTNSNGKPEFNHPEYPCCGPSGGDEGQPTFWQIPHSTGVAMPMPISPAFVCDSLKDCVVANTRSLYFTDRSGPDNATTIGGFPKLGTLASEAAVIATLDAALVESLPVGLAANDDHVVWSVAVPYPDRDAQATPGCRIFVHDLATAVTTELFATTRFSCVDAALDATSVYFAIVSVDDEIHMRGDGIGRISFADHTFESIALGMIGASAGPRRVYVDGGDIYAIDPHVIGKIAKSALDGKADFSP